MKKQLLVIGGGFAGFWSAISAIRQSREINKSDEIEVTLVNVDEYFTIRPRLYEVSLDNVRIELSKYFKPLGIKLIVGKADAIDPEANEVTVSTAHGSRSLTYDYLILASGSGLKAVNIQGIENTYNVDSFTNAMRLENHLEEMAKTGFSEEGATTFVVVGGGLTGIEAATSIAEKAGVILGKLSKDKPAFKTYLIEHATEFGRAYSPEAQEYLVKAIAAKNIEIITGVEVSSIDPSAIHLSNGKSIVAKTVIWSAGMLASPLTKEFKNERDSYNRLKVDAYLKLPNYDNVIIAGDVANMSISNGVEAPMACQYSNFTGRWAGHNAVNDLFNNPLKEYIHDTYVTCLDLGEGDALFTRGWDRKIEATGQDARNAKVYVNTVMIYPPIDAEEAVTASVPEIPAY